MSAIPDINQGHDSYCRPDIVHAHDWQSAPVVFGDVHPSRSIFTIHNMEFGVDQIGRAVAASSVSTTVSPTYATEVAAKFICSLQRHSEVSYAEQVASCLKQNAAL